jgi:hypothetical protein
MCAFRLVACVMSLASVLAAHVAHAESLAHRAQAPLHVGVRVVSTCSIDSAAAQPVRCGRNDFVMVVRGAPIRRGPASAARIDATSDGQFSITTINF